MKMTLGILAILFLAGCGQAPGGLAEIETAPSGAEQRLTLIAIDNSGSTSAIRRQIVAMAYDVATELDPQRDAFKAYTFAGDIHELTSEVPSDEDAFATLLSRDALPTSQDHGTDYSQVLARLADVCDKSASPSIRLIVAGDGFSDNASPAVTARFQQAQKSLAANSRIKFIYFYGVQPGAREKLQSYLDGGVYQLRFIDLGQGIGK